MKKHIFSVSAPAKIHLLGEHSVVYGKPAILGALGLRVTVTISQGRTVADQLKPLQKIIDKIVKKELALKKMPQYSLQISSDIPVGAGLGSSAAVSASYIGALLSFLRVTWNLDLINKLAYVAEKIFHGDPSGGDNATVTFGGLIWFRKEDSSLKLIQPLSFIIPSKLAKNFVLINTGKPKETTLEMVNSVKNLYQKRPRVVEKFLETQEKLVRELLPVIKEAKEKEFIRIIKEGEKNLESIGVASKSSQEIIRKIEKTGGAAKICGAGGKTGPTGILLCFHPDKSTIKNIAKLYNLSYFNTVLGVGGVKKDE